MTEKDLEIQSLRRALKLTEEMYDKQLELNEQLASENAALKTEIKKIVRMNNGEEKRRKIMNYDNMTAVKCEGECSNPAEVTLAETLNDATLMASDVLQMAYAINQHLFGKGPVQSEGKEPKCFRDALKIHANLIRCVADEMRNICDSLGV